MERIWRAWLRTTVPMLFHLGVLFNFLIGGPRRLLSDVPSDVSLHGELL